MLAFVCFRFFFQQVGWWRPGQGTLRHGCPAGQLRSSSGFGPRTDHCDSLREGQNVIFLIVSWGYKRLLLERK